MAKFPYDVNTTRRIIDVYKQFKGGLKTVDTDDALGAVFLRQAENISLSEFGFIEKRYGTFENFKAGLPVTTTSYLQGYWEFLGKYIIVALDGRLYTQNLSTPTASFTEVTQFYTKDTLTYPTGLASYLGLESDFSVGSGFVGFQTDREMGATIISDILYMFTGKYPIYFVEEDDVLKAYLFAKETPSYSEIVVTGHNLIEDDYDGLYYGPIQDPEEKIDILNSDEAEVGKDFVITDGTFSPSIAYAKDGSIDFKMSYKYNENLNQDFILDTNSLNPAYLNEVTLKSISARPSGPGATDLSFTDFVLADQEFNTLNNVPDFAEEDRTIIIAQNPIDDVHGDAFDDIPITTTGDVNLIVQDEVEAIVGERYWGWKKDTEAVTYTQSLTEELSTTEGIIANFGMLRPAKNQVETETTLITAKAKDVILEVPEIPTTSVVAGETLGLKFFNNGVAGGPTNIESRISNARTQLASYLANDTRSLSFYGTVRPSVSLLQDSIFYSTPRSYKYGKEFVVWAQKGEQKFPIWRYFLPKDDSNYVQAYNAPYNTYAYDSQGRVDIETNVGSSFNLIQVTVYDADFNGNIKDDYLVKEVVQFTPDFDVNDKKTLQVSDLQKAVTMYRSERDALNTVYNKISKGTRLEVYTHHNGVDTLFKSYTVNRDSEFTFNNTYDTQNDTYMFTIPDDIPTTATHQIQSFKFVFKTVDVLIGGGTAVGGFTTQEVPNDRYYSANVGSNPTDAHNWWTLGEDQLFAQLRLTAFNNSIYSGLVPDKIGTVRIFPNISQLQKLTSAAYTNFEGTTNIYDQATESEISASKYIYDLFPVVSVLSIEEGDRFAEKHLNVKVSKGLLSGTYDFRFVYELKQQRINYQDLKQPIDVVPVQETSFIFKDVPVSPEKLTDFTFFQGDKAHPVWSCNKVIDHFNKLMIWGSKEMPQALFYSFPDRPFYFPSKFYLEFTNEENLPLVSVVPYSKILVVQTEASTWGVKGNSGLVDAPSPYIEFSINPSFGTIAPKSVRPVRNKLFFLSRQGVVALNSLYAVDDTYNIDLVDRNITNIVPQDKDAVGIQFDNQYWLNFPNNSITLRWYINQNAWVQDKYLSWSDFNGVFKYQIRDGKLEFITYPSTYDSDVYIYKIGVDYDLPVDITQPVASKFETSFLNQNYPFHPKNYKETKLDFTLQNEYNNSTTALYTMNDNEDITNQYIHFIDNIAALPNHFYRVGYDFRPQTRDLDAGTFTLSYVDTYDGDNFLPHSHSVVDGLIFLEVTTLDANGFATALPNTYDGGSFSLHASSIVTADGYDTFLDIEEINETFGHLGIEAVSVREFDTDTVYDLDFTIADDHIIFQMPNVIKGSLFDVRVLGNFKNYIGGASITDVTFDDKLTFKTWVVSEDKTLNLDNINSYDQAKADVDFNLANRLGTWTFGTSNFGNTVTAVKTIKLSGKGYNAKLYMEDNSKSKWTLESLGLTYKMKRARSR